MQPHTSAQRASRQYGSAGRRARTATALAAVAFPTLLAALGILVLAPALYRTSRAARTHIEAAAQREARLAVAFDVPGDAPAVLRERYGATAGFGRSVGEVALHLAAVPVASPLADAASNVRRQVFAALILCLAFLIAAAEMVRRNLSERRRNAGILAESEAKFRGLFENAVSAVAINEILFDERGEPVDYVLVETNPAFEKQTGVPAATVLGRRMTEIFPDKKPPPLIGIYWEIVRTGSAKVFEEYIEPLHRHYHISAYPLGGNRLAVVFQDISERKRAEQALREQTTLLETVLDGIPDLIALQTPDHAIIRYNRAGYEFLGCGAEDYRGRKCYELIGRDRPCEVCATRVAVQSKEIATVEKNLPDQDRWFEARSIPVLDEQGAVRLVVEQLRDVTDRKRDEESLRRAKTALERHNADLQAANGALEKYSRLAESSARAKSQFLANMSHEIRTPMTAILGFAEMLLGEAGIDRAPPQRVEAIRTIQRNGEYLLALINDILDISKIEAGKLDVERIRCLPVEVLSEVVSLMQARAAAKNLPLTLEYAGGIPEVIHSDPIRLRQILINLVGNAIKFTETGSVRVVARLVEDTGRPSLLRIDVIDSGIGMRPDQIERLFTPFSQADSSTTRRFGGTGLGLTISKRLAEILGGSIAVRSQPGRGSTFSISVETGDISAVKRVTDPRAAAASGRRSAGEARVPSAPLDCCILLAEDGPDNQRLISFLLEKAGAQVTLAENGQVACDEALAAQAAGKPFDVILMDMQMPLMDGYQAARRLRSEGCRSPILALTAHAMEGDEEECLAAGCDGYLTKPIHRTTLIAAIAEWIASPGEAAQEIPHA